MATPKIKIKRNTGTAVSVSDGKTIDVGEPLIDLATSSTPKLWIGNKTSGTPTQTDKVWIGAAIEDTMPGTPSSAKLLTQSGIANYISGLSYSTLGVVTLADAQTITGAKTFSTNNVVLDQVGIAFKESDANNGNSLTLNIPNTGINGNITLTLPSDPPANTSKVLGVSSIDGTGQDAQLSWVNAPITVAEVTAGTGDYAVALTNSNGTALYKDFSSGALPTNGPLKYSKDTGALIINGNLTVNGPVAETKLTPSANVVNGANTISLLSTSGLAVGQEIGIFNTAGGATLPANTTITAVTANTSITLSNGVTTSTTVSGANLTNLFVVATGAIDIGPSSAGNDIGNLYNTNVPTINIGATDATTVNIGKGGVLLSVGDTSANSTLSIKGNNTATLTTNAATFNLANTNATTVNIGGAATTLTLGGAASATTNINNIAGATTVNIATGVNTSGIKTINIGTGTGSGGTSAITLGSNTSGANNNIIVHGLITNAAGTTPGSTTNALVTKGYVDSVASGVTSLTACVAATYRRLGLMTGVTNVTFSSNVITITGANFTTTGILDDGVTLVANATEASASRVLIKNEGDSGGIGAQYNGVYYVSSATTLTRTSDADSTNAGELVKGAFVLVTSGTNNNGKGYVLNATPATLNTNDIVWNQFTQSVQYVWGNGLLATNNQIDVVPGPGLRISSDAITLSTTIAGSGMTVDNTNGILSVDGQITVDFDTIANFGATESGNVLTAGSNGAFTIDGQTIPVNSRILVKAQNNPTQNGVYTLTTVGSSSPAAPAVLTRIKDASGDYNTESSYIFGKKQIFVKTGSANRPAGRVFLLRNTSAPTIGTDAIHYIGNSSLEGSSFTPERYSIIGAPANLFSSLTAKSYTIIGTLTSSSVNANSRVGINVGSATSGRQILDALRPGMVVTQIDTSYRTTVDLVIDSIDRSSAQKVIYLRNMTSSQITGLSTTANIAFTFDGPTASGADTTSYNNASHKGILVYKDKDMVDSSILGYNTAGNYWSYYTLGLNGSSTQYRLATTNNTETFENKTLTSPTINSPTIAGGTITTNTLTSNVDLDILSGKAIYIYKNGDFNTSTRYRQSTTKNEIFSYQTLAVTSGTISYAPNTLYGSIRTGTRIVLDVDNSTWSNVSNTEVYYAVYQTPTAIKLARSYADAIAATPITINNVSTTSVLSGKIIIADGSLIAGSNVQGNTASLYLPSFNNTTYDKIFGNSDEITVEAPINISANGISQIIANSGSAGAGDGLADGWNITSFPNSTDSARTRLNQVICTPVSPFRTNLISSIALTANAFTAVITFAGNIVSKFTTEDYLAINLGTSVGQPAERTFLNKKHYRIHSVELVSGNTQVTVLLSTPYGSSTTIVPANTSGQNQTSVSCVKNYEFYVYGTATTSLSTTIGGTFTFSMPSASTILQNNLVESPHPVSGWIVASGNYYQLIRTSNGLWVGTDNLPFVHVGSAAGVNDTSSTVTAANTISATLTYGNTQDSRSYTGKRILINTLIDCGTY